MTISILAVIFMASVAWFYRDPERRPPDRTDVIVAPADGRVARIQRFRKATIPRTTKDGKQIALEELVEAGLTENDYYLIAIVLSPFDVHTNRAPITGRIVFLRKTPGQLLTMRNPLFEFVNERVTTVFQNERLKVGVIQIAAPITSSIRSFVRNGNMVQVGQRIGVISLGSQVAVIIPAEPTMVLVTMLGSKMRAGETILAEVRRIPGQASVTSDRSSPASEGTLDVQAKGVGRFLQVFYLANLWFAALWLRLAVKISEKEHAHSQRIERQTLSQNA